MSIEVECYAVEGLRVLKPRCFVDHRGYFLEIHHIDKFRGLGLNRPFLQDNLSFSSGRVLRGLHFQYPRWQAKLVTVVQGEVFDAVVDVRPESPTFGRWQSVVLSGSNHFALYVPEGYAHGFCVLSETAHVLYKCSELYCPSQEQTLRWNDPDVGVRWPIHDPILSEKDAAGKALRELRFEPREPTGR